MSKMFVCLSFLLIITDVVLCKPDYIFYSEVDGWIKLHEIPVTWSVAFKICHYEGAVLATPVDMKMINALLSVMTEYTISDPIHIGVHSKFSEGDFMSIEGVRLTEMPIKWGDNGRGATIGDCLTMTMNLRKYYMSTSPCKDLHAFMCYKKLGNNTVLNECGTFDNGYQLNEHTGSCYKLHEEVQTWSRAHMICAAEGGHLVILNSKQEVDFIRAMVPDRPNPDPHDSLHIGALDWNRDGTWATIHGEELEKGYHNWAEHQPDNIGTQNCGSILRDGTIDNKDCLYKSIFVCEKYPNTSRFGPTSSVQVSKN